jgi:hypothetical protein
MGGRRPLVRLGRWSGWPAGAAGGCGAWDGGLRLPGPAGGHGHLVAR